MNKVIRIALFVLFIFQTDHILGQGASVAIDKDRKAWLGFNVGGFWQGSDIRPTGGAGSSLLFDYYFIRNNHSVFGIGVRGQYVKATSLGLGITRDYNIQNNPALNGSSGNPDYASLTGGQDYVFQNYSTEISDLSGNVIISLNRLRAVSRINLYVFGGIGGTGYIASMNQRDASGNLYDYNLINSNGQKSEIKDGLKNLRDDTYETYGEGGNTYSWAFTPTVGAGFGIQLSSRVQLSIEHKVGFTGTDLLDGNKYGTSNSRNDIYHYASFGLSYGVGKLIGGDGPVTTRVQPRRTPVLPVTPEEPTLNPPTIRITSPTSPSVTVENCNATIRAIVENVVNEEGISVLQDRIPIPFDFSGRSLTVSNINFTGTANFTITVKNDAGTASKAVSFTCQPKVEMITICHRTSGANTQQLSIPADEWPSHQAHGDTQGPCPEVQRPELLAPTITINAPATSPVTLENCLASINATIENITSKEGISVIRDRTPVAFEFSGGRLTVSNVNFTGTANFMITAINSAGQATQTVSFICQPPVEMITICHRAPGAAPQEMSIPSTEWPSHQSHGDTQGVCPSVQILAAQLPVVTITSPANSPIVLENCRATIRATVDNIDGKQNITVTMNDAPVDFTFLSRILTVSNMGFTGTANFAITATNSAGTATQTVSFVCQPPVQMITICHRAPDVAPQEMSIPSTEWSTHQSHGDTQGACPIIQQPVVMAPVVTITSPTTTSVTVENCKANITATVDNITDKQNITVTQNENPVAFEFADKKVTVTNVDFTGTKSFVIKATNSAGTATQTVSFVCQPPVQMITICHRAPDVAPQEMSIPSTEWSTHQSHGDTQGACPIIQQPVVMAPVVTITSPTTTSVTVENCKANITATVDNITDKQNITVTQNESPVAFEFTDKKVTVDNLDFTGTANFAITATNSAGTATQTVSFVCQPPVQMITICHREAGVAPQERSIPSTEWSTHQSHGDMQGACPIIQQPVVLAPVVTITSPATSTVTVENCKASIIASVTNIIGREGIIVTQNLTPVTFEYVDNKVTIPSVDFTGTANFVITATNSAGTVTQTVSFVCQPKQITICHIPPGNNGNPQTITIAESAWPAHQAHGDSQGECPIIQSPTVTISAPTNSPITVEDCKASITATVENITNQQGISVTQNGTPVTFIFVDKTVTVSNLGFTGTANFVITATNSAGTATQTASFICQPKQITICHIPPGNNGNPQTITIAESAWPAHQAHGDSQGECPIIQSPTVTISAPANSPITVEDCKASITATVENITNQQGISVTQNGTPVTFIFVDKTVTVSNLGFTGTADFVITATNSAGTATQTASFICQPKQITICHIPPGNNGNPQTITIAESAWPAHQAHGDVQGACPVIQAPVVTITSPTTASVTVENCKASITATVENITDKQNITVTQNENPVAFEFADKKVIVTNVDFSGTKSFVIKATNSAGTATQTVSFVCQPKQITICHIPPGNNNNPQTITITESAWPAHQAHGDTQGACPEVQVPVDEETSNDKEDEKDKDKDEKSEETDSDKITICHHPPGNRGNTQTLTIPASAWPAHEKHGDTKGPCKD